MKLVDWQRTETHRIAIVEHDGFVRGVAQRIGGSIVADHTAESEREVRDYLDERIADDLAIAVTAEAA